MQEGWVEMLPVALQHGMMRARALTSFFCVGRMLPWSLHGSQAFSSTPSTRRCPKVRPLLHKLLNAGLTLPPQLDDPSKRRPDITLARERLKWSPAVVFEEGLVRTVEYFRGVV
jgi:hypothetical protein